MIRLSLAICLALSLASAFAQTQSNASVEEIIKALAPAVKTRSLGRNLQVESPKIDLSIAFDFDSAKLKDDSKPQLDRLVEALKNDRLASLRFQVEGHTDAQGSASYNDALSTRRADAVVTYLTQGGVEKDKLQSIGKGFTELLDPNDPRAAKNRRVRVLTLE